MGLTFSMTRASEILMRLQEEEDVGDDVSPSDLNDVIAQIDQLKHKDQRVNSVVMKARNALHKVMQHITKLDSQEDNTRTDCPM